MEHEVFVPVPARRLRAALADPARVARAVPGLQQDAGAEPVAGRLKLRIGGHSITYRGTLCVSAREDGTYAVEGAATESRGTGSVEAVLTIRLRETGDGTTVTFDGTASAGGRIGEFAPDAVRGAVTRLLNRFVEHLATPLEQPAGPAEPAESAEPEGPAEPAESAETLATEDFAPLSTGDFETTPDADDAPVPPPDAGHGPHLAEPGAADPEAAEPHSAEVPRAQTPSEEAPPAEAPSAGPSEHVSVFDTEVPPPSLDPSADADDDAEADDDDDEESGEAHDEESVSEEFGEAADPPAEAAHARRTMIGRSAEEVDHAPPRGRYAPVPAPLTVAANPVLRWAAPAAALVVASAIVVGRALRRRR